MNRSSGFTPLMRIVLLLAGAAIAIWGMGLYTTFINSLVLSVLIVLASDPLINWLRARSVPAWAVLLISLVIVFTVLGLLALVAIYGSVQFITELPTYEQQAQAIVSDLGSWLQSLGLSRAGADALAQQADPAAPLTLLAGLLGNLGRLAGNTVTLILLTTFLFVDVVLWPGRLQEIADRGNSYARRLVEFTRDLRQYIVVMVVVGACVGALNSVWFVLFGVPLALLWGVLSGILNFIPFIGFWLGLIPPAILTLLAYGPERMLIMAIGYVLINSLVQNVIQPRLVVSRLNLTPFLNLVSVTFWPLVLGPVGAIIGVPLTMGVRTLFLEVDPATRWLAALTSSKLPEEIATQPEFLPDELIPVGPNSAGSVGDIGATGAQSQSSPLLSTEMEDVEE